ncbi:MAG: phosphoribosyl-ATP diphosphatase [Geminicoccaceae bacterium]|nr:phosphoribosyl-ATP diphosphatase [Geminicoccaceae bacterium]
MIVPSIDLMGGQAVQLIGGETRAIDAGDPFPIAERFAVAGEIAVIDLDAAMRQGSNAGLIEGLVRRFPARVGGGIRDVETALSWLDTGAVSIILGTMAVPEVLKDLPKARLIAALDARNGEVVVEGWKTGTGRGILERVAELKGLVAGFLVTFVELEGRLGGTNLDLAKEIVAAARPARVTIAGGVTTPEEVADLDAIGADAQVGMALYTGRMDLGEAVAAPLRSDRPDGLVPTVVADAHGVALGLVYSSRESVKTAVNERRGVYHSRSRGGLWRKGETSGATQELLRVDADCDRDALRFTVRQAGAGFCHTGARTCFGEDRGLPRLARRLHERRAGTVPMGSYTKRLFDDPDLLAAKITEEARELVAAASRDEVVWEAADVLYFTLCRLAAEGIDLAEVERHLDLRERVVRRRG